MKIFKAVGLSFALCLIAAALFALNSKATGEDIRVGLENNLPLQGLNPQTNTPDGIVVEVLDTIAEREGWTLTYVSCEWEHCLEMLESGELDLLGGIAYSEERAKHFDFTEETLINNWGVVCVSPDSDITEMTDLNSTSIAMIDKDIYSLALMDLLPEFEIEATFIEVGSYDDVLHWVENGTVDAGVVSRTFASFWAEEYDIQQTTIIFNPIAIRFAATQGQHVELLNQLDQHLAAMKADPESDYYLFLDDWFGSLGNNKVPNWVGWLLSFAGWAIVVFVIAILGLRREVNRRTEELKTGNQQLQMEIEERLRAEDALRVLNEVLEQRVSERTSMLEAANKELEAFAYSVSHDLRSPLRAIQSFSEILQVEYNDVLDEEGRLYVSRVRTNAVLMDRLILSLLTFSRLSRRALEREEVYPSDVAQMVVDEIAHEINERDMHIHIDSMPTCWADITLLRVVYANLISNAVKFTQEVEQAEILVGARQDGDKTVYFVKDNGIGFDMRYADKIFEVFQRLHGVEEFSGSGVGLAIVQRIVRRHGGRIWTESEVGDGATFYFTLGEKTDEDEFGGLERENYPD